MLYFEARTDEEEKKYLKKELKKQLKYAMRENWEGQINDILKLAEKKGIEL